MRLWVGVRARVFRGVRGRRVGVCIFYWASFVGVWTHASSVIGERGLWGGALRVQQGYARARGLYNIGVAPVDHLLQCIEGLDVSPTPPVRGEA